ncbi:hypothetical protein DUGA6_03790 [Duganella sp. HH105]|nr:hypothetical protein DUGA6_03790 [Duganella sp. HH105]OFA06969.1 hypothetical protein DUGA2_03010 [Duganella sp. HH101]
MSCCLAWNISLFPETEQEDHIDRIWKMVEADNEEAPPLGLEQGFKQNLRMLVVQKQELFPWTHTNIPKADLIDAGVHDVLRVVTGTSTASEINILAWPNPTGLPLIIEHLRGIQSDTAAQVDLLQQASRMPGAFTDIEATQMTIAYCVQRADLVGYRCILTVWRDTQPAASVKRVIGHWLGVLAEIEDDTKTVLNILISRR